MVVRMYSVSLQFAVIGFVQEAYNLREQTSPYSLQVAAVQGFLPQDMVLRVTAIPGTACKAPPQIAALVSVSD